MRSRNLSNESINSGYLKNFVEKVFEELFCESDTNSTKMITNSLFGTFGKKFHKDSGFLMNDFDVMY